jgi:hypothetical protein
MPESKVDFFGFIVWRSCRGAPFRAQNLAFSAGKKTRFLAFSAILECHVKMDGFPGNSGDRFGGPGRAAGARRVLPDRIAFTLPENLRGAASDRGAMAGDFF